MNEKQENNSKFNPPAGEQNENAKS